MPFDDPLLAREPLVVTSYVRFDAVQPLVPLPVFFRNLKTDAKKMVKKPFDALNLIL